MAIQVNINRESWPRESEFRISRGSRKVSDVITVSISEEKFTGRGECFPYARSVSYTHLTLPTKA